MLNYCGMRYVKIDEIILIAYVVLIVHAFMVDLEIEVVKLWVHVIVARLGGKAIVDRSPFGW